MKWLKVSEEARSLGKNSFETLRRKNNSFPLFTLQARLEFAGFRLCQAIFQYSNCAVYSHKSGATFKSPQKKIIHLSLINKYVIEPSSWLFDLDIVGAGVVSQMAARGVIYNLYNLDDQYQNPNTNNKDNLVVRLTRSGVVFTNSWRLGEGASFIWSRWSIPKSQYEFN